MSKTKATICPQCGESLKAIYIIFAEGGKRKKERLERIFYCRNCDRVINIARKLALRADHRLPKESEISEDKERAGIIKEQGEEEAELTEGEFHQGIEEGEGEEEEAEAEESLPGHSEEPEKKRTPAEQAYFEAQQRRRQEQWKEDYEGDKQDE